MNLSDGGIGASRIPDGSVAAVAGGEAAAADFSRVLVVGRSPVNRIAVSRIVERCGLKPLTEAPEAAAKALDACLPGMVVLDGGADDADCDALLPQIAALRGRAGRAVPCVILLSTQNGMRADAALADAVVAKPITPERLPDRPPAAALPPSGLGRSAFGFRSGARHAGSPFLSPEGTSIVEKLQHIW